MCFGLFLADLEQILGQKVAFPPPNFIKGKSRFQGIPIRTKTATESRNGIIFTFRKKFWIAE